MTISYSAPVPVDAPIEARCKVVRREGRRIELEATVGVEGSVAARGPAAFITVSPDRYDGA